MYLVMDEQVKILKKAYEEQSAYVERQNKDELVQTLGQGLRMLMRLVYGLEDAASYSMLHSFMHESYGVLKEVIGQDLELEEAMRDRYERETSNIRDFAKKESV